MWCIHRQFSQESIDKRNMYVEILKIGLVYMCHSYKETSSGLLFRDVVYSALCPIKIYLLITATQNELLSTERAFIKLTKPPLQTPSHRLLGEEYPSPDPIHTVATPVALCRVCTAHPRFRIRG